MSDTDLIGLTSPPQMPSLGGVEESSPSSSPTSSRPNKSWPSQPTKKRSHEEMNALQSEGSLQIGPNPSTVIQSSTTAPTMPSPQLSSSTVASLQHKPPTSGQTGSESGTPEQQLPNDEPSDDEPDDPNLPVADFSWDDMEQRYHDTIEQLETDERRLFAQFESLCNYFTLWSQTLPKHEVERSFKRLKTQMTFVQHEEDELEQRRLHYIKVVDAFKSVLGLIGEPEKKQ